MGKKEDLKLRLAARDALIKGIADALEIDITEDIDMGNVARYSTMFLTSLGSTSRAPVALQPFEQLVDAETRRIEDAVERGTASAGEIAHMDAVNIRQSLESVAQELDLGHEVRSLGSFALMERIAEAIGDLKGAPAADPGAVVVPTNDSLAQAIAHERRQRGELEEALAHARAALNRVAGAMQIDRWDADGTELVERAQRWASFKLTLRTVANQWRGRPATEQVFAGTVAQQLQALLTTVVSTKEFARWFERVPKTLVVSQELQEIATDPPAIDDMEKFTPGDVIRLHRCVSECADHRNANPDVTPGPLLEFLDHTFKALAASVVGTKEFCDLMNLVVLPILARQSAAGTAHQPSNKN